MACEGFPDSITDMPEVRIATIHPDNNALQLAMKCEDGKPYLTFSLPQYRFDNREDVDLLLKIDDGGIAHSRTPRPLPPAR